MSNILVTGGAGYVGSHACKALAANGLVPVVYDSLVSGHEWAVRWGPLEKGDVLNFDRLDQVFTHYKPSAVLHFAAYAYVGESMTDPARYYRNNVAGTVNLLEVMRKQGVARLVFSSTCSTYGIPDTVPISELHPQNPINPYGLSKLMVERILCDYALPYNLKSISLRYFNAAGADPGGQIGEEHDPETHLIPLTLSAAKDGTEITLNGADYDTPDGTCIRDFIHVTDLASAHVRALKALDGGCNAQIFNLGTGKGFSVREVLAIAQTVTGREIRVKEGPRRPGDPPRLIADASRAMTKLGWRPEYTDLYQIIATAWNWMSNRQAAIRPIQRLPHVSF
jgi:UDP-arabinose 4-epimerase